MEKDYRTSESTELGLTKVNPDLEMSVENQFEEDIFVWMPKIREMIYLGRDATESITELCREVGLQKHRFMKIYNAIKKEQQVQLNTRITGDYRMQLIQEADEEISKIKQERQSFVNKVQETTKKYEEYRRKEEDYQKRIASIDSLEEKRRIRNEMNIVDLGIHELKILEMKPVEYNRALVSYDQMIHKFQDRKAKLSGVEVQRKEIVHASATDLIAKLYGFEKEQYGVSGKTTIKEAKDIIDAEFFEEFDPDEYVPDLDPEDDSEIKSLKG